MATKKIPALPAASTLDGTEQFEVVQSSTSKSITTAALATDLAGLSETTVVLDNRYVKKAGDTMTGDLAWDDGGTIWTANIDGNNFTIQQDDEAGLLILNPGISTTPLETIADVMRYSLPVTEINANALVTGGRAAWTGSQVGAASSVLVSTSASNVTFTIRAATGSPGLDFRDGNFFAVFQSGNGGVTVTGEPGVTITTGTGYGASTRSKGAMLFAYCVDASTNNWVVTGEVAGSGPEGVSTSINAQTGTSYTALVTDQVITMNNASANYVLVQPGVFTTGQTLEVWQYGAGQTEIRADSGMTIRVGSTQTLFCKEQYSGVSLRFISSSEALLIGDTEAA